MAANVTGVEIAKEVRFASMDTGVPTVCRAEAHRGANIASDDQCADYAMAVKRVDMAANVRNAKNVTVVGSVSTGVGVRYALNAKARRFANMADNGISAVDATSAHVDISKEQRDAPR